MRKRQKETAKDQKDRNLEETKEVNRSHLVSLNGFTGL
jgi:hypothetical protein